MLRAGVLVAGLVGVSLWLTACSSGTTPAASGSTAPKSRLASSPASSPQPSPSQTVRIGAYTQVFAPPPANAAQAKVIAGFREAQILWVKSDQSWRLVPPVTDYVTGQALGNLTAAVSAGKTRNRVPAGTDRFFHTRVSSLAGGRATVVTCDDGSKYREINPSTGQVDPAYTPTRQQSNLFETWQMVQRSGHWAIAALSIAALPNPKADQCQP
jgi:hypothetical protein